MVSGWTRCSGHWHISGISELERSQFALAYHLSLVLEFVEGKTKG